MPTRFSFDNEPVLILIPIVNDIERDMETEGETRAEKLWDPARGARLRLEGMEVSMIAVAMMMIWNVVERRPRGWEKERRETCVGWD